MKKYVLSTLMITLVSGFLSLFLYFNNSDILGFNEVFPLLMGSVILGLTIYLILLVIKVNRNKAALLAGILVLTLLNFVHLENLFNIILPSLSWYQQLPLILFVVAHVMYFINRYLSDNMAETITMGVTVAMASLLVVNGIGAVPSIINKMNVAEVKHDEELDVNVDNKDLPNIYVLLWDEMASFNQMEKTFGYDNIMLKEFLEENHFTNSLESYNYSVSTNLVTANYVNYDYVLDKNSSVAERDKYRNEGKLYTLLEKLGYDIQMLSEDINYNKKFEVILNKEDMNESEGKTIDGQDIKGIFFENTVLSYFMKDKAEDINSKFKKKIDIIEYVKKESEENEKHTFILQHLILPHQPFLVDENGAQISGLDMNNWSDKDVYKGQYIYASKLMTQQIEHIIKHDPTSLIITMSDHGARATTNHSVIGDMKMDYKDMSNIFNAFYYNKEDLSDYKDHSAVNTLRLLLNHLFDLNLDVVEVPKYDEE